METNVLAHHPVDDIVPLAEQPKPMRSHFDYRRAVITVNIVNVILKVSALLGFPFAQSFVAQFENGIKLLLFLRPIFDIANSMWGVVGAVDYDILLLLCCTIAAHGNDLFCAVFLGNTVAAVVYFIFLYLHVCLILGIRSGCIARETRLTESKDQNCTDVEVKSIVPVESA